MDKCFDPKPHHCCSDCGRRFKRRDGLARHLQGCNRRGKAYLCFLCGASLSRQDHLRRHWIRVHGESGPPLSKSPESPLEKESQKAPRSLPCRQYQAHNLVPTINLLGDNHQDDKPCWYLAPNQLSTEEFLLGDYDHDCEIASNSPPPLQDAEPQRKNLKRAKSSTPGKEDAGYDFPRKIVLMSDNMVTFRGAQSNSLSTNPQVASLIRNENSPPCIKIEKLKEELVLEDNNDSDGALQDIRFDKRKISRNAIEDNTAVQRSPSRVVPIHFETVLCVNDNQIHALLPEEDPVSPFETVICGDTSQGEQDTIEDETNNLRIVPEPTAEFTTSESSVVIKIESVNQNGTKPLCKGVFKIKEETNSPIALTRLTSSVGTSNNPPAPRNRDNDSLGYSIPANGCNIITNGNTATTNYSNVTATFTTVANPPDSNAIHAQSQPPHFVSPPRTPGGEDLKEILNLLKKIPVERRKKTKDKVLSLVKLISELNIEPEDVSFSVNVSVCVQSKSCD